MTIQPKHRLLKAFNNGGLRALHNNERIRMKILNLLVIVSFVVLGAFNALGQRFQVPLGPKEVREHFERNIKDVQLDISANTRDVQLWSAYGTGYVEITNYVSSMGDAVTVARQNAQKVFANYYYTLGPDVHGNAAITWGVPDTVGETEVTLSFSARAHIDPWKPFNEQTGQNYGSKVWYSTVPFRLEKDVKGQWVIPASVFDSINLDEFYAGQPDPQASWRPSPNSFLAIEAKGQIRWVGWDYDIDKVGTGGPRITRSGWDEMCKAGLSEADKLFRNSYYVYLPSETLAGRSVERQYTHMRDAWLETRSGPKVTWYREIVSLWYDEERTVGDQWTIMADDSGLHYDWKPVGYKAVKVEKVGGLITFRHFGLAPNALFTIVPTGTLNPDAQLTTSITQTVMSDERGVLSFTADVDQSKNAEFFIVRPATAGELATRALAGAQ